MMHGMMMDGHGLWWGAWPLLGLWVLLKLTVWALLLTGLVLVVRWLWRETSQRARIDDPLEVVRARYARG
jgi:uncharacterized membrane protein